MKNTLIYPSWEYVSSPRQICLSRKYKPLYYLAVCLTLACVSFILWEFWNVHELSRERDELKTQMQQVNAQVANIAKENKRLDAVEAHFDYVYPFLSNRYSVSQIFASLADNHVMPTNSYFSRLDVTADKDGSLGVTVNLVSTSKQRSDASQDMDKLRTGVSQLLNTVRDNNYLSEYRLQAYNALGDPIARGDDKETTSGFEVSELWKFSVHPISKEEIIRMYEILRNTYPIKQK